MRRGILLALCAAPVWAGTFTERLWQRAQPIYQEILEHPFLKGLVDGSLPRERFEYYLEQDSLYLGAFSRALLLLAAKAPRESWSLTLARHAIEALEVERQLHERLLRGKPQPVRMMPVTKAYTDHLLATVSLRPFEEGLAAVLPCYWIYWEVGKQLKAKGSVKEDYQRWIDQYASPEYGKAVEQVLEMMEQSAAGLDPEAWERVGNQFETSSRYEYWFWDAAWRLQSWAASQ